MELGKYSIGIGDRFGRQGEAQLAAVRQAQELGVAVTPVWNKSNREHTIVGTTPADVRAEADAAARAAGYRGPYFVDADHINLGNVDGFIAASDFFTLDVADAIGQPAPADAVGAFVARHADLVGTLRIAGLPAPLTLRREQLTAAARQYLFAVQEAGRTYRHVAARKGAGQFVTEVSMDETASPQTPTELLIILAALADEQVPAQTVAPKFTGRFNKGVDYVGDVAQFTREFEADLAVIAHAVRAFGLPADLKLSVHSGSDKFALYGPINRALRRTGAGLHLKTAGTTWLEEVIGLAEAGGDGLELARDIYRAALARRDEMCRPYATVLDLDPRRLPDAATVNGWTAAQFVGALRHERQCPAYNPHFRQLLHVGYKVAAELGQRYRDALARHAAGIGRNVTANLFERHLRPLFVAG